MNEQRSPQSNEKSFLLYGLGIPFIGLILGSLTPTSDRLTTLTKSFLIGLGIGILGFELLPEVVREGSAPDAFSTRVWLIIGFVLSFLAYLLIRYFVKSSKSAINDARESSLNQDEVRDLTASLVVDYFIDSFFIGLVSRVGKSVTFSLLLILGIEMFLLILSLKAFKNKLGIKYWLIIGGIFIIILFGLLLGSWVSNRLYKTPIYYLLFAFNIGFLILFLLEDLLKVDLQSSGLSQNSFLLILALGFILILLLVWLYKDITPDDKEE